MKFSEFSEIFRARQRKKKEKLKFVLVHSVECFVKLENRENREKKSRKSLSVSGGIVWRRFVIFSAKKSLKKVIKSEN